METYMEAALNEAQQAYEKNEVPVGCIFIYDSQIIAAGSNEVNETKNATRHAEIVCIDQVLKFAKEKELDFHKIFKEITVIVTVEPCIMCAAALHELEIKEIIFGCKNDRFGGNTVLNVNDILGSNIRIQGGIKTNEAMNLLKLFYKGENPSAPSPKLKK